MIRDICNFEIGDNVQIHDPAWTDASGRRYSPGRNHEKTGVVTELTDHNVGNDRLYWIAFGGDSQGCHWGKELRKHESRKNL